MFSFSYDRAMVIFLSCIKEFADFAHSQVEALLKANGITLFPEGFER